MMEFWNIRCYNHISKYEFTKEVSQMSKKRTKAIRNRKQMLSDFSGGCLMIMIVCFFALFTVQHVIFYANAKSNTFQEYSGHFERTEINYLRNTKYRFVLPNGDVITADPDIMQHNKRMEDFSELHFLYTAPQNKVFSAANNAVAISTTDGGTDFLTMDDSIEEAKLGICIGAFFTILWMAITVIYWFCFVKLNPRKK